MNASVFGAQIADVFGRLKRTPKLLVPSFSHPAIMHFIALSPTHSNPLSSFQAAVVEFPKSHYWLMRSSEGSILPRCSASLA